LKLPVQKLVGWGAMKHVPRVVRIEDKRRETPGVVSFVVRDQECAGAKPGQFAMVWIPGVDEIPMSILPINRETVVFAVKKVGEATKALARKKIGDQIGIRGPYGSHFRPGKKGRPLLVGGGTGIVPLTLLMKNLENGATFVIGARTKSHLFFLDRIRKLYHKDSRIVITTDDGTRGVKGLASKVAADLCEKTRYSEVFACGPEQMIRTLYDMCDQKHVPLQASLERIMKCGVGICGSCSIGKYRACIDGPVFRHVELQEVVNELGEWKRNHSGRIVPI
jgi:dihydroorotate dehydrogenase electron transfer subunit